MNNNNSSPIQDSEVVNTVQKNLPKFGNYLREARESLGMTVTEVSERMKLSEDIVKALESSNIAALPAPAFTQGYIKGYVRLLKIPLDEVMLSYDQMVPEKVQALTPNVSGKHVQKNHDGLIKWVTYGLVSVALILFVIWFQQNAMQWIDQSSDTESSVETTTENAQEPEIVPQDMAATSGTTEIPVKPADVSVEIPVQPAQASQTIKPVSANSTVPVTDRPKIEKLVETKNTVQVSAGEDLLILHASDQSWTEIQDADGNRLFFELMEAGDEQRIKGRAPFKVFLGNAPVVTITMNDQPVDIRKYVRQNKIAHISISAKAVAQGSSGRMSATQVSDQFIPAVEINNE